METSFRLKERYLKSLQQGFWTQNKKKKNQKNYIYVRQ